MNSRLIAGCGYVGFRAAKLWASEGCRVTAITRGSDRAAEFMAAGLIPLVMDLAAPEESDSLPTSEVALWAVGMDRSSGVSRQKIWIDGLRWFVHNLPTPPRRFIYVSSTSVYGSADGDLINEASPTNPTTEGGECCVQAEQLVREECGRLFPETQVVVLRMAGIYGPDRLLRRVADLQSGTPLPGNANQWLNLIHVDDAVRMINRVAISEDADVPEVINVVNSNTVTRHQYYSELARLASAAAPQFGGPDSSRPRGGNKRVSSLYCREAKFEFDDVLGGLRNAWAQTSAPL